MIVLFLSLPPDSAGPICQPVHLPNDMGRDVDFVVDTVTTHSQTPTESLRITQKNLSANLNLLYVFGKISRQL